VTSSGNEASTEEGAPEGGATAPDGTGDETFASEAGSPGDATSSDGNAGPLDATLDAAPPDAPMAGDDAITRDANPPAPDASGTDLARPGLAYTWQSMTSATADTGKVAAPALNDGSPLTQVNIDSSTGDHAGAWEGAGVVFPSGQSIASVAFVQGITGTASTGDGWFEANFGLQFSTDGMTWSAAGWSAVPAYAYSSAVSGKTFGFSGPAVSGVRGIRVVGQVNTVGKSWWAAANEISAFGP
jgi:hypothetical protein